MSSVRLWNSLELLDSASEFASDAVAVCRRRCRDVRAAMPASTVTAASSASTTSAGARKRVEP